MAELRTRIKVLTTSNPYNSATKMNYAIPKTDFVTLKIYDVLGNEVATLVNEEKQAGSYKVEFQSAVGSWQVEFIFINCKLVLLQKLRRW